MQDPEKLAKSEGGQVLSIWYNIDAHKRMAASV